MKQMIEREPRLPLHVPVVSDPALLECWSVNVSRSGFGLMAIATDDYPGPLEGSLVEAELRLPDSGALVQVTGRVAWRHDTRLTASKTNIALGLGIEAVGERGREALENYLQHYRFRVAVGFANDAEQQLTSAVLGQEVELLVATSAPELSQLAARGDIAVLLLFGGDREALATILAAKSSDEAPHAPSAPGFSADLRPRVVACVPADTPLLLRAFNRGSLCAALGPQPLAEELREAVLAACQQHGVRIEQHRLGLSLERALWRERAKGQKERLPLRLGTDSLVHASEAMAQVLELVRTVAPFRTSVLLTGETGAGKEVVARLVHELSGRAARDFIVQDCGTLTETLLESELFGNVKGAYTGAIKDRDGLFVAADGGTVLLDEIENTSPSLQAKLLRVIETGEVRPVGGTERRVVDVRLIAASNQSLESEVAKGRFRADLYYRLSTFPIRIAPLRERRADILPLARRFLRLACESFEFPARTLTAETEAVLESYDWPGNARELRNVIERAVLLCGAEASTIGPGALPQALARAGALRAAQKLERKGSLKELVGVFEAEVIREALAAHDGSVRLTASALATDEATLWRKAKRYQLKPTRRTGP